MNRGELVSRERRAIWLADPASPVRGSARPRSVDCERCGGATDTGDQPDRSAEGRDEPEVRALQVQRSTAGDVRMCTRRAAVHHLRRERRRLQELPGTSPLWAAHVQGPFGARAQNEPRGHVLVVHRPFLRADAVSGVRSAVGTARRRPVLGAAAAGARAVRRLLEWPGTSSGGSSGGGSSGGGSSPGAPGRQPPPPPPASTSSSSRPPPPPSEPGGMPFADLGKRRRARAGNGEGDPAHARQSELGPDPRDDG